MRTEPIYAPDIRFLNFTFKAFFIRKLHKTCNHQNGGGGGSTEEKANKVKKPEEILDMENSDQDSW